jgi:hypothetical protein
VIEMLPTLQAEVEALHADVMGGEAITAAAIVTTMTGPAESVSPEGMALLERMMGGRFGAQMANVWAGNYADYGDDESAGEWAFAKEATYHAGPLGYAGDDLGRILEELMRAGPYRPKHDSPRTVTLADGKTVRTTWLGMTIGRAIKAREAKANLGPLSVNGCRPIDPEDTAAAEPTETPEQIIARLEREVARLEQELAKERAQSAIKTTIIRGHNRVEGELRAELERMNRRKYAEWRLRRSKLKSSQVDTLISIVDIGTQRAEYHQTDTPIITGENIAKASNVHESTARANADVVCSLPGSPITRATAYRTDGKRGQLTTYTLPSRDPVEILEQMVTVAEALETRESARPRVAPCPEHPKARVNIYTQHECSRCGRVLASTFPDATPLCEEVTRIEPGTPSVVETVVVPVQHPRIGVPDSDELAERRAAVGMAVPISKGHAHTNGNGHTNGVALLEPLRWRCPCTSDRRTRRPEWGDWVCTTCSVAAPSPEERP